MQPSPMEVGYLTLAFAVSGIVWLVVFWYVWQAWNLPKQPSGNTSAKLEGRGSWYARNINTVAKEGLFSAMHFGLVVLIIWSVMMLLAPSFFPELLESTWIALPGLLCMGFVGGTVGGRNIEKSIERRRKRKESEKNRHVRP